MKLGSAIDIWHLFNSWSDGAIFCFTFHMFEIRSFSNHMRKIGQINLRCTHIAKLFIWLKLVRWPVSCCCFEKFQQQHGLRDVHKILNNSIDTLFFYGRLYGALKDQCGLQGMSFFTRPTMPLSKRTLIPCGCVADFVRTSLTMPSVSFPDRWSCFCTTLTRVPGLMSARTIPFICIAYKFNDSVPIRWSAPLPCPEGVTSLQGKHLREEIEDYRDVHKLLKYSIDI